MTTTSAPPRPAEAFDPQAGSAPGAPKRRVGRRLVIGVVALAALGAAAVALLLAAIDNGGDELALGKPKVVTVEQLRSYAASKDAPVYWAGPPAAGFKLELTEVRGGRTFVRYLATAAPAGDPKPGYTTIATYPANNAYATTKAAADRKGAVLSDRGADGVVLHYKKAPLNVYVAKPGDPNRLIEVFAPNADAAQSLATSKQLVPVR